VWWRLTNSIGFVVKHLRRVPHKLNDGKLAVRVQMPKELLTILHFAEHQEWPSFMGFDELWFYLSTDYESI
jgi:hypothetical protein